MVGATHPGSMSEILPGQWRIRASNMVHWLSGDRLDPVTALEVVSADPLTLVDELRFTDSEGKQKIIRSRARWHRGAFKPRGGIRMRRPARWRIGGISEDGNVMVVHRDGSKYDRGIDVLGRAATDADDPRAIVSSQIETFGLTPEEFASLTWFPGE